MTSSNALSTAKRPNHLLRAAIAAALVSSSPYAFGQSASATLRGQVSADAGGASGATVSATNTATGLSRTVQTGANGSYSLGGLPAGEYKVQVTAGGQTSSQLVNLQVGQTATLDLAAGPATAEDVQTVTVSARRLTETKTSEIASYVSIKQIESLPQSSRNFLEFADTVPGINFINSSNGSTEIRAGAQSANGINVFIDGVGQKNYVSRGGVGGQGKLADSEASNKGTRGNPFPQLAIGEYKVITSNYKAEFDQVSSAAIVAGTRSGTNQFEAEAFYDRTTDNWRAKDPLEEESGVKAESQQEQYGVALGGPIIQDRMHFFITYEKKKFESPQVVTPNSTPDPSTLPAELQGYFGSFSEPFDEDLFFGKLDLNVGDAHLFELSAKIRDESDLSFGIDQTPSRGTLNENKDQRFDLRYQFSGASFQNDAHITYEDAQFSPRPASNGPGFAVYAGNTDSNTPLLFSYGGGNVFDDRAQKGWGFQNDLTFNPIGNHTIKAGIKLKLVDLNVTTQSPVNQTFRQNVNDLDADPWAVSFGAPLFADSGPSVSSDSKMFGIYIQDDWDVTNRLQLNLGLRYDFEKTPSYLNYVTPAIVVEALNDLNRNDEVPGVHEAPTPGLTYAQTLALSGLDINDYISTGNNRKAFDGAIQPRLGFSFDMNDDQRHVIFGGAGRSYDRNVFEYLAREATKGTYTTYTRFFENADVCQGPTPDANCIAYDPAFQDIANLRALQANGSVQGAALFLLDNNLDTPYSDQFSLGMRNRLTFGETDWETSATLAYIEYKDGIVFLNAARWRDGLFRRAGTDFDNNPWNEGPSVVRGGQVQEFGFPIIGVNGVEDRSKQLLLSAVKPYTEESGWSATFAYTFTDATENRSNTAERDETYQFDFPTAGGYGWHGSTGVPRHRLVATGVFDAPWGVTISAKGSVATPKSFAYINCAGAANFSECGFSVAKPDTTLGERQVDFALQKTFSVGDALKLRVRADILNVFNWSNADSRDEWRGGPDAEGPPNANFGNPTSYLLPTRTFKLTLSTSWK